ncbi:uncharacterized protein LOC143422347 [Xylocopa sonorina]|uniref:uncharacterized protein LOC143422347 n=1 Tax=Xylocopa sonorina TaxID=1818115 RepID=UPI00403AE595
MCSISTRLDALNRQLVIISKLQKMEEEYGSYSYTTCKKCNVYNNHDKCCHCIHRIISLKEQCNKFHCTDECLSYENKKKKILCNLDTCKTRRKVDSYKNAQLTEAQTYLKNDAQISTSTYIENDIISKELEDPQKESKSNQINLSSELYKMHTEDKILDTYEEKSEQTIPTKDYDHTELKTNSVSMINTQYEVPKQRKSQTEINNNNNNRNETENTVYNIEDICIKDRKIFEGIQKVLLKIIIFNVNLNSHNL